MSVVAAAFHEGVAVAIHEATGVEPPIVRKVIRLRASSALDTFDIAYCATIALGQQVTEAQVVRVLDALRDLRVTAGPVR